MTQEEFDSYKFSSKTKIKYKGEWRGVSEVWFDERRVGFFRDVEGERVLCMLMHSNIEDIKND